MAVLFKKIYEENYSMPGASSIQVDSKIYFMGGYTVTWINSVWAYDFITNTYSALANIPIKCTPSILGEYNGNIYILINDSNQLTDNCRLYAYNIASNTWSEKKSYPVARMFHVTKSTLYNGYFYTFGYWDGDNNQDVYDVYRYNIVSDIWYTVGKLPTIFQSSDTGYWRYTIRQLTSNPVSQYLYFVNPSTGAHYRYNLSNNTAVLSFTNTIVSPGFRIAKFPYLDSNNIAVMISKSDSSKPYTAMADYYIFNISTLTYTLVKSGIDIPLSGTMLTVYNSKKYLCAGRLILSTGYGNSCRNVYLFDEFFPLIRYWTGAEWKECENVYVWNGSQWIEADNIYVWNGSSYVENS